MVETWRRLLKSARPFLLLFLFSFSAYSEELKESEVQAWAQAQDRTTLETEFVKLAMHQEEVMRLWTEDRNDWMEAKAEVLNDMREARESYNRSVTLYEAALKSQASEMAERYRRMRLYRLAFHVSVPTLAGAIVSNIDDNPKAIYWGAGIGLLCGGIVYGIDYLRHPNGPEYVPEAGE